MAWLYETNNKKFTNKFKAIDEFEKTDKGLLFTTPDLYQKFDFSMEPDDDFLALLKEQAIKLRDEHRYLRLFHGGGPDSHMVLRVFVDNKIKLDEVVVMKSGFKSADFELDDYAIPQIQKHRHNLTETQVRVLEPSLKDYEAFYASDWVTKFLGHEFECTTAFFRIYDHVHNFDDGALNIYGKDKGNVIKHFGSTYFYLLDEDIEPTRHNTHNFFVEDPKIFAKQTHMIMKQMALLDQQQQYRYFARGWHPDKQDMINKSTMRYQYDEKFPVKKQWRKNDNCLQHNGKTIYYHNNKEKASLQEATKACPHVVDKWFEGVEQLAQGKYAKWFNQGRPELGLISTMSLFYCLDDNTKNTVQDLFPGGFTA